MSKALKYLGLARKAGVLETGEDNSSGLVKAGKARLLIVASDTSEGACKRAEGYVFETFTVLVKVPYTKLDIADTTGKSGCSMAAMTDPGLSRAFVQALFDEFGEDYAGALKSLNAEFERIAARKAAKPSKGGSKTGFRRKSV